MGVVMLAAWAIVPATERSAAYAELLNADSFEYTAGDTLGDAGGTGAKSGGTGWSSSNPAWNDSEGEHTIVEQSLQYTDDQGYSLITSGNRVEVTDLGGNTTASARREYTTGDSGDQTFGDDSNDPDPVWFSALVQGDSTNQARSLLRPSEDGSLNAGQGTPGSGRKNIRFHSSQTSPAKDTGVQPVKDSQTVDAGPDTIPSHNRADMLVTKVSFDTDGNQNDTAKLWVNPNDLSAGTLTDGSDAEAFREFKDFADMDFVKAGFLADLEGAAFDEVRVGTSFSDVSPRTPLPPSFGLGASCLGMMAAGGWWRRRRSRRAAAETAE